MRKHLLALSISALALAACTDLYPKTPTPDYTIGVMPTKDGGMTAIPPGCPSFTTELTNPYESLPMPQFGCATARNLAMMIERPEDLVQGRSPGPAIGVTSAGSINRYYKNQTRGLVWVGEDSNVIGVTTSSNPSSDISGEAGPVGGGAGGGGGGAPVP